MAYWSSVFTKLEEAFRILLDIFWNIVHNQNKNRRQEIHLFDYYVQISIYGHFLNPYTPFNHIAILKIKSVGLELC